MKKQFRIIGIFLLIIAIFVLLTACTTTTTPKNTGTGTTTQNGTTINGPTGTNTDNLTAGQTTSQANTAKKTPLAYNLYFVNKGNTALVAERRDFTNTTWTAKNNLVEMATEAINSLIAGPTTNKNYYATVPKTTAVNYVKQETDGILHVDLSKGYINGYKDLGTPESMSVYSLVSTLTGLDGVNKVRLTVDGKPLKISNITYSEPLIRNEKLISTK